MGYCGICGRQHDPNVLCSAQARDVLQDIGIRKRSKKHRREIRRLTRAADRYMFTFFVVAFGLLILFMLFFALLGK